MVGIRANDFYNTAVLYSKNGELLGEYVKGAPVPLFLDGIAGEQFTPIHTEFGEIGLGICYDLDNPFVVHQTVANGAQLLIVPTADSMSWTALQHEQHAIMGPIRAVEYRRWILRPASSGHSQIIDPLGRILGELPIGEEGVLEGDVAFSSEKTIYLMVGRIIPWGCLTIVLASVVVLGYKKFQRFLCSIFLGKSVRN